MSWVSLKKTAFVSRCGKRWKTVERCLVCSGNPFLSPLRCTSDNLQLEPAPIETTWNNSQPFRRPLDSFRIFWVSWKSGGHSSAHVGLPLQWQLSWTRCYEPLAYNGLHVKSWGLSGSFMVFLHLWGSIQRGSNQGFLSSMDKLLYCNLLCCFSFLFIFFGTLGRDNTNPIAKNTLS